MEDLESLTAEEALAWALARFHPRIALAASFGAEDMVLVDMLVRLEPGARVFTLDTAQLPAETYSLIDRVRERYGLAVEVLFPRTEAVEAMVRTHGVNLFYASVENRKRCWAVWIITRPRAIGPREPPAEPRPRRIFSLTHSVTPGR